MGGNASAVEAMNDRSLRLKDQRQESLVDRDLADEIHLNEDVL